MYKMDNEDLPVMRQKAKSQDEILEDLKVIEASEIKKQEEAAAPPPEDLTQDPFVKPIKPTRSKKPISEKQKEHLARARAKATEMKQAKLNKTQTKIVEKVVEPPKEPEEMDEKEFEKWLKNYDKFTDMMNKIKAAEDEKRRKQEAKEKAIEDRLRAKIEAEYAEKLSSNNLNAQNVKVETRPVAPPPPKDPYSSYFDEY
jgi:hypothetical protein